VGNEETKDERRGPTQPSGSKVGPEKKARKEKEKEKEVSKEPKGKKAAVLSKQSSSKSDTAKGDKGGSTGPDTDSEKPPRPKKADAEQGKGQTSTQMAASTPGERKGDHEEGRAAGVTCGRQGAGHHSSSGSETRDRGRGRRRRRRSMSPRCRDDPADGAPGKKKRQPRESSPITPTGEKPRPKRHSTSPSPDRRERRHRWN
jgi:hypothetical protein